MFHLLIGKGYPVPNNSFRWCTDRLKIRPTASFLHEQIDEKGEAIVLIGTRYDESKSRERSMRKHENKGSRLSKHTTSINTSGKVTFAFWIYREGDGCSSPRVFQFGDGSKENDLSGGHFVLGWANGEKRIFIEHASAGISHRDYNWGSDLDDRTWYHIAYTFNGSIAKLYINGTLINYDSYAPYGLRAIYDGVYMGTEFNNGHKIFNGKIASGIVYNRELSATEILQNFNAQKGRFGL